MIGMKKPRVHMQGFNKKQWLLDLGSNQGPTD